ncbi:hypothetical protein L1286_03175 [Pseudoalteromonas sp. SMS1]|uniref:hypothetical protein n=1 Tax=Pseudoalteromonas sp. SMS1 TaxID=2908894 RepID=UPI001F35AB16|nr:hypothetical protein [Pseudoalteromonas sp. SMS1]MCF2856461.1 hypothetical protein [Pseudoalteromonas sp. SMS1]
MSCEYFADKGMKIDGNYWLVHPQTGEAWTDETVQDYYQTYETMQILQDEERFAYEKQTKLNEIKQAVFQKLNQEQWRVTKAQEHALSASLAGDESAVTDANSKLATLLEEREALRKASDKAELTLCEITTQAELDTFMFDVNISQ